MTPNKFSAGVGMAIGTIVSHKLRSLLTVLGVVIGTSTIIGVGSIITGLDSTVVDLVRTLGSNTIIVTKMSSGIRLTLSAEERRRKPLTLENARAIAERCPSVESASPYLMPPGGLVRAKYRGADVYGVELGGTDPSYSDNGMDMLYGRYFSEMENQRRRPVVAIGEDVYKAILPNVDPIGKWIDVDGRIVQVVGVIRRPAIAIAGAQDTRVLFPYFTMRKIFPAQREHAIIAVAKDGMIAQAQDEIRTVLRIERRVGYNDPDSFSISTADQIIEQFRSLLATTALVMVVLSSIGLLVGGIGVMNIMLVSVTERTREIGVRKAVGARSSDIILQFLTEAVVLTGLGGLLGMAVGWLISIGTHAAFPNLPTSVPLWAVGLGVVVSVSVGLFFGIWPASKAAGLDPVEALRYE